VVVDDRTASTGLDAERRAGELLKDLQKAVGARTDIKPRANMGQKLTKAEQIKNAGLTEKQAKSFQRLASVPQEIFDDELKHAPRPTTSGIIKAGTAPPLPFTSTARRFPPSR
jgi:hypothetical protein